MLWPNYRPPLMKLRRKMLQRILDRWEQKEAGEQASTNFR